MNRTFYSGITGHVRDSLTARPLEATVEVVDLTGDSIVPRVSDCSFGRFYHLLQNGTYTLRFSKTGYDTMTISDISVISDSLTKLEIRLAKTTGVDHGMIAEAHRPYFEIWPNPFRQITNISFDIEKNIQSMKLRIFDVAGQLVKSLHSMPITQGSSQIRWDGCDNDGKRLPSGIYFLELHAEDFRATKKLVLLR